jgi:fumarate hydratase class II
MDAVPVTVGQELGGYAAQVRQGVARLADALPRLCQVPLGGTATGSGLNVHPEFAERVRRLLAAGSGLPVAAPAHPFEATGARDALVEASGALRVVAVSLYKIANDLRWLASGPRTGLGELVLPELQKGSTMMPGKVNPVIPEAVTQVAAQVIGNDAAVAFAGTQGQLELNAFAPVMARNVLHSAALLTSAAEVFRTRCVEGLEADVERCRRSAERTLAAGTSLNPLLGYDLVGEIVREAWRSDRTLREVLEERGLASPEALAAIDPRRAAAGGILS